MLVVPKITAQTGLARRSEKRADQAWIENAFDAPDARVLFLIDLKIPLIASEDRTKAQVRWFTAAEARALGASEFAFLGEESEGAPRFACNISGPAATALAERADVKPLVDLRTLALQGSLSEHELLIASQARALLGWHETHRCCTRCGARTRLMDGGWRRQCSACLLDAYPRTDPAVIMLITHGERCLLAHEPRFPQGMFSTLAGYVEAGDDIEHAVRREVLEEAGVEVGPVSYVASQPWPFPYSLMIGCWGEAKSDVLKLDPGEIAEARWFDREEVRLMLNLAHPQQIFVPPPLSMAHVLLRAFVDGILPPTGA